MMQATKWWFAQSYRRRYLFAQDPDGNTREVYMQAKPGMTERDIEMNLVIRMQKKHGLHTEF